MYSLCIATSTNINFLEQIFNKFHDYNLQLHPKKMTIATTSAIFWGFTLQAGGYSVDQSRCKIVKDYHRPKKAKEVKRFLGISNYFRHLIKNYSKRSVPLRELMVKDKPFEWSDHQKASFCDIWDALCSPLVLGYPTKTNPEGYFGRGQHRTGIHLDQHQRRRV